MGGDADRLWWREVMLVAAGQQLAIDRAAPPASTLPRAVDGRWEFDQAVIIRQHIKEKLQRSEPIGAGMVALQRQLGPAVTGAAPEPHPRFTPQINRDAGRASQRLAEGTAVQGQRAGLRFPKPTSPAQNRACGQ